MFWPHNIAVKFRYIAVVQVFVEDIPQWVIVLMVNHKLDKMTPLNIFSLCASVVSIIISMIHNFYKIRTRNQARKDRNITSKSRGTRACQYEAIQTIQTRPPRFD